MANCRTFYLQVGKVQAKVVTEASYDMNVWSFRHNERMSWKRSQRLATNEKTSLSLKSMQRHFWQ
jgi:hypothetical protein